MQVHFLAPSQEGVRASNAPRSQRSWGCPFSRLAPGCKDARTVSAAAMNNAEPPSWIPPPPSSGPPVVFKLHRQPLPLPALSSLRFLGFGRPQQLFSSGRPLLCWRDWLASRPDLEKHPSRDPSRFTVRLGRREPDCAVCFLCVLLSNCHRAFGKSCQGK